MENQVTQLKLNVTNIKSSLLSSNKQLKKLKTDKKNLFFKLEKKQELRAEETRLETPRLGIGSGFSKIMSAVTSPVRSIFDRILDFIGLIAAGILINNLPIIIEKIQEFFNSDFIKGVGNVLGIIGNAILGLAKFIGIFPKSEQDKVEKNIKETDRRFDEDIKDADAAEKDIVNLEKFLGQTDSGINEAPIEPIESDTSIPQSISEPPLKETSNPSPSNTESNTKEITASKPAQSFNSGGTVRSEGPSQTPSLAQKQTYTPQKSGVSKKVQRDANDGFTNFPIAVDNIHKSTKEQEKNIIAFSKMLKDSKGNDLVSTTNNNNNTNTNTNNNTDNNNSNTNNNNNNNSGVDVGKNIVGYVGSTGRSSGPHIHIETGDGYGGAGGSIPSSVLSNIIVSGKPLSSYTMGDGIGAGRNHRGFDYPIAGGSPITLSGGLKYVEYDAGDNAGYGNSLIIEDSKGNRYLIGHLSGGPSTKTLKHLETKTKGGPTLTPIQQNKYRNNKGGGYRLNRSMNNQSVFIYAIQPQETFVPFPYPMPIETPAPSSSSTPQLSAIWRT